MGRRPAKPRLLHGAEALLAGAALPMDHPLGSALPGGAGAYKTSRRRGAVAEAVMKTRLSGSWLAWGGCALLVLVACLAVAHGPECKWDQYEEDKRCCQKCPPGKKVKTKCSGESGTICLSCESGRFQAGWTQETQCTPHDDCHQHAGLVVHAAGNAERNVVCRCRNGTHCFGQECDTCQLNRACGPGEGVQQEANHVNDTVCVDCADGFFSNVSSATARCQAWSSCEDKSLIQKASGTRTSDVVCSEEARRTHSPALLPLLVLLPLAVLVVGGAVLALRKRKDMAHQQHLHQDKDKQLAVEVDEECPALPIQETLLGGQLVAQEDGKESRLAEQEQV